MNIDNSEEFNVKLDHLGPIIINSDGTLSRIPNWDLLSDNERSKTLRLIAARNTKRKALLETKQFGEVSNCDVSRQEELLTLPLSDSKVDSNIDK